MEAGVNKRILIVEDDLHIAEGIKLNLGLKGYTVEVAPDGLIGLSMWENWRPDLIILDIMLPGIDGLSLLRTIRLVDDRIPILILSAKGDAGDIVQGFIDGVDDYLAKPFDLEEFLLRVDRLMVRASRQGVLENPAPDRLYRFGDNWIDFRTMTAQGVHGRLKLTEQEVKLLRFLIACRGKPVSRAAMLEMALDYPMDAETRTIDNFMVRFRKYFEKRPNKPVYFKSVRSVGYMFTHDPDSSPGTSLS